MINRKNHMNNWQKHMNIDKIKCYAELRPVILSNFSCRFPLPDYTPFIPLAVANDIWNI